MHITFKKTNEFITNSNLWNAFCEFELKLAILLIWMLTLSKQFGFLAACICT